MSSRIGIAAQALGVAALAAIVYFAFLHPDDSGPLQGIDVRNGAGAEAVPGPARRHRARRAPRRRGEAVIARGTPRAAPADAPSPAPSGPSVTAPGADTPAGSQYGSAVARILGRVSNAR